ncbi:hypothetical protein OG339_07780 [Streptosporangium sp. NBC_01495]|uniref:hypothetical protein n=1 Tax=Streptosporangium sp. NBC_01495 TaxID=2903899 RepID=UPI003FCEA167
MSAQIIRTAAASVTMEVPHRTQTRTSPGMFGKGYGHLRASALSADASVTYIANLAKNLK